MPFDDIDVAPYPAGFAVGLALTHWEFVSIDDASDKIESWLLSLQSKGNRNSQFNYGYITYPIQGLARLCNPVPMPSQGNPCTLLEQLRGGGSYLFDFGSKAWSNTVRTLDDYVSLWYRQFKMREAPRMYRLNLAPQ